MSKLDPRQTIITLPANIPWQVPAGAPPHSVEEATLAGSESADGIYLVLMKWYPGFMSAPTITQRIACVWSCPVYGGATVDRISTRTTPCRPTPVVLSIGSPTRLTTMAPRGPTQSRRSSP